MSELEQALNEFNAKGELLNEVEVDMDDLDMISFHNEQVPEGTEWARFEPAIYFPVSNDSCDPINLKCNMSCSYSAGCIFNPYSEYYNMPIEDFKEKIAEQEAVNELLNALYETEEGQQIIKDLEKELANVVIKHIEENR